MFWVQGGGGTAQKYSAMNEVLILLIYQVKWLVTYGRLQKSINLKTVQEIFAIGF